MQKILKIAGGSTKDQHYHLLSKHKLKVTSQSQPPSSSTRASNSKGGATRGNHRQKSYDYIVSIQPTSVESERAFSAAGFSCSKNRTRLNDEMIDALSFLRWYFQ